MNIVSSLKPNASAAVGATLLALPSYFIVASALRQNAPGLSFLGSPVVLLGSLLIAFIQVFSVQFGFSNLSNAIVFGLLIATLVIRPSGLLGQQNVRRV